VAITPLAQAAFIIMQMIFIFADNNKVWVSKTRVWDPLGWVTTGCALRLDKWPQPTTALQDFWPTYWLFTTWGLLYWMNHMSLWSTGHYIYKPRTRARARTHTHKEAAGSPQNSVMFPYFCTGLCSPWTLQNSLTSAPDCAHREHFKTH
jgi:hypothetical protein